MHKTVVLNVVGLTPSLLKHAPFLSKWAASRQIASINPVLPAVTCSVQASYLTGKYPQDHGIVANGWYFRDECEVKFWRQSNKLVQAQKIWEAARALDPSFTCANLFWWYNMYSSVDISVTPRPMYPADGRKIPDIYTQPAELRFKLQERLGTFPLFEFWGPKTTIRSTQWIAQAAIALEEMSSPTLTLIYLPHLDYCLQRVGTDISAIAHDLQEIDTVCQELIQFYESHSAKVIVLSEYGITPVSRAVSLNRVLREHGYLAVREELGRELLDPGASAAFAVADHQIAHIYVSDRTKIAEVQQLIEQVPGVDFVLGEEGKAAYHLNHPRSGELVAVATPDAWFTYYYWFDDQKAPDFARTVDIHRKPGYDPVELFVDPTIRWQQLKVAKILLQKQLGFRTLMDIIPLDASLVKGSHGRIPTTTDEAPLLITQDSLPGSTLEATDVYDVILSHLL
ncbi:alkaline phosphatase family protein [Chroogloeocystis siderophila]|jgi:predicted AlkP superfamily pyrophosphatase or phosphodiesterase|uniref:Alkaline phosphatase family protein n=1 Tax=Chroogloeocystis siderophila 5.2 s.c.1 TaxID=247279 RepID=A0A1U7HJ91_9CHRO|nr:nucleotide pyrophosphatase/phosphodiesterase family protein [Chroogloeocystis siderophila]OKH23637.1 alkaline phosphatase family protein [Chroogloeocystis siderophila 5.2 s.c.1]